MELDKRIKIIRLIVVLAVILTISLILRLSSITNVKDIIALIRSHELIGITTYILLFAVLPTFFVPVTILAISAGAVFGFVYASIYTFIGAFLNSTLSFSISKYFAYDLISDFATKRYNSIYQRLKETANGKNSFTLMVILRLLPFIPYTLLNYISGVVGYNYKVFITSTLVGIIPGMLCYVNIGAASLDGFSPKLVISISILVAFSLMTSLIARKFYNDKLS